MTKKEAKIRKLTDEELCLLAREDAQAEGEILSRYKDLVRRTARTYYILGSDREDVVQEGMIGLFKAIHHYDGSQEASFRTYAGICVRRQILDAVKAAARKKHEPLNTSLFLTPEEQERFMIRMEEEPGEDLLDLVEHRWRQKFSPLEKSVLEGYLAGDSYALIAEKLGKDTKAVYNAMERIKGKIRRLAAPEKQ